MPDDSPDPAASIAADNKLAAALNLSHTGFAVHWLRPRGKAPIDDAWQNARVHGEETLRRTYREGHNVGIRLGEPSKIGDLYAHVIDLDVREPDRVDEARAALLKLLPDADNLPTVISGSGGHSRHYYILTDRAFRSRKLARSATFVARPDGKKSRSWEIELFGTGKQVAAPPSIHPSGKPYRWERPFDAELVGMGLGPIVEAGRIEAWGAVKSGDDDATDLESLARNRPIGYPIEKVPQLLKALPLAEWCEDREGWLKVGMTLHHEYGGGDDADRAFDLWCEFSRQSPKFNVDDQRRNWDSFRHDKGSPVTLRTLIEAAGKVSPDWDDDRLGLDDIGKESESTGRLSFLSPTDCVASPAREYLVKGILSRGDVGCIFGAPGAGKSALAPYIGYALANGRSAFGMRTRQGGVFYVAAEDQHGMRGRVQALHRRHGDAELFTLVCGVSDLSKGKADLRELRRAVAERKPSLIVIDTLAMAFPGLEENTSEDMGNVVQVARSLTAYGAAVLLIHHDTKAGDATPRGHSVLNGALDVAIHVTKAEDGIVRGRLTKNRNGPCDRDIAFRIESVTLGTDEDGDSMTAAVCTELPSATGRIREPLNASEKAVLDVLIREGEATLDEWRDACVSGDGISGAVDRAGRRKVFNRAREGLYRKEYVALRDGRYTPITAEAMRPGSEAFDDLDEASSEVLGAIGERARMRDYLYLVA